MMFAVADLNADIDTGSIASSVLDSLMSTMRDVVPIVLVIVFFQAVILRRKVARLSRVIVGFGLVVIGLSFFLVGLDLALFPLGTTIAKQLASPEFLGHSPSQNPTSVHWTDYYWTYIFAFTIGVSATIAEPALLAVAIKANQVSGGTIKVMGLRLAVALGAGIGVTLGTIRIAAGIPLPYMIFGGYILVILQTIIAPKQIVPLAYDTGGVTTSTVTVPLVAALGLGLASSIPDSNPLTDGFGIIALTVLFPMVTVMGYAKIAIWMSSRPNKKVKSTPDNEERP